MEQDVKACKCSRQDLIVRLRKRLADTEYRPGYEVKAKDAGDGCILLEGKMLVTNADNPTEEKMNLYGTKHVPVGVMRRALMNTKSYLKFIRQYWLDAETHELGEFLKYQGVKPFDPHGKENGFASALADQLFQEVNKLSRGRDEAVAH